MPNVPLRELAQVIRSKNAGPFELTFASSSTKSA
jgi:hypothetical protein